MNWHKFSDFSPPIDVLLLIANSKQKLMGLGFYVEDGRGGFDLQDNSCCSSSIFIDETPAQRGAYWALASDIPLPHSRCVPYVFTDTGFSSPISAERAELVAKRRAAHVTECPEPARCGWL